MATKEKEEKVGKFEQMITASDKNIKDARGKIIAKATRRAAENLVRDLEDEVDKLETEILNLTDLGAESSFSLRPTSKDFNAEEWVNKLHQAKLDVALKKIELEQAEAILTEWF